MNEAMKNLLTRRSVRSYADRPVPEDALRLPDHASPVR